MHDPKEVRNESAQPQPPKALENVELEVRGLGSVALAPSYRGGSEQRER